MARVSGRSQEVGWIYADVITGRTPPFHDISAKHAVSLIIAAANNASAATCYPAALSLPIG